MKKKQERDGQLDFSHVLEIRNYVDKFVLNMNILINVLDNMVHT